MDDYFYDDNNKDLNTQKYEKRSRYHRHSGPGLELIQRWTTRERHWRKMGEIEKKKNNIQRRKTAQQEINDKINIPKPYIYRNFVTPPLFKANPIKFMPKLFEKIKREEISKKYISPVVAHDIYNKKYIDFDYNNNKLNNSYNFISTISNIDYCNEQQKKIKAKIVLDDNLNIISLTNAPCFPELFSSYIGNKDIYICIGDKLLEINDVDITHLDKNGLIDYLHKIDNTNYVKATFFRSGKKFTKGSIKKDIFY